jgi:hypothetical protein
VVRTAARGRLSLAAVKLENLLKAKTSCGINKNGKPLAVKSGRASNLQVSFRTVLLPAILTHVTPTVFGAFVI